MSNIKRLFDQLAGQKVSQNSVEKVFHHFDSNRDGVLDKKELKQLINNLATSGAPTEQQLQKLHDFLDADRDGVVSRSDFLTRGVQWLNVVFNSQCALVIVDVQNDFISGSLALKKEAAGQDGEEVVAVINRALDKFGSSFKLVIYSYDWHPKSHISFVGNVTRRRMARESRLRDVSKAKVGDTVVFETDAYGSVEQRLWPEHCVQHSFGAELHSQLKVIRNHEKIYKGTDPDIDSYSAFWDNGKMKKTELFDRLVANRITDVVVCGLATDVCVGSTAFHAQEHGFRTALFEDASRGISNDGILTTKAKILNYNGIVVATDQLGQLLQKKHRPVEWLVSASDCVEKLKYEEE